MLAVNPLPPEEILTLEEMHKNHPCHAPRIRAHAILLSNNGFKLAKIASIFNICRQTAAAWLHAWKDGGICALFDKPRSGRPPILCNGKEKALLPFPPLKTVRESFPSYGSSLY